MSLVSLAALPVIPAYSISKAAAFNITQSLRALLAGQGVTVHAVVLGPIDTDMNRGFEIPEASPESAGQRIFDGLDKGEDDTFPDPASLSIADGWRNGAVKALEHQFAAFVPKRLGLVPEYECFNVCSNAWGSCINGSLPSLIITGKGRSTRKKKGMGKGFR